MAAGLEHGRDTGAFQGKMQKNRQATVVSVCSSQTPAHPHASTTKGGAANGINMKDRFDKGSQRMHTITGRFFSGFCNQGK